MTFLVFMGFEIIFFGYLLGRVRIKGVGLGTAGVFIVAILFGVLYSTEIGQAVTQTVAAGPESVLSVADAEALVSVGYPIALIGIVISSQFFVLLLS